MDYNRAIILPRTFAFLQSHPCLYWTNKKSLMFNFCTACMNSFGCVLTLMVAIRPVSQSAASSGIDSLPHFLRDISLTLTHHLTAVPIFSNYSNGLAFSLRLSSQHPHLSLSSFFPLCPRLEFYPSPKSHFPKTDLSASLLPRLSRRHQLRA